MVWPTGWQTRTAPSGQRLKIDPPPHVMMLLYYRWPAKGGKSAAVTAAAEGRVLGNKGMKNRHVELYRL